MKLVNISIILFSLSIFFYSCTQANNEDIVKNGVINIENTDIKHGILLNGSWKFFTNTEQHLIEVPGNWNNLFSNGVGKGIYEVLIINPKNIELFLYIDYIYTSYEFYVDDDLIAKAGFIGENKDENIPELKRNYLKLPPKKEIKIRIKVENVHNYIGGIPQPILLGDENTIRFKYTGNLILSIFLFGVLFVLSIYHLILWLFRKSELSLLFLFLSCFFICIRIISADFFLSYLFDPNLLRYQIEIKITYIGGIWGFGFISIFINSLYKKRINLVIQKVLNYIFIAITFAFLFLSARFIESNLLILNLILIFVAIWNLVTLFTAIKTDKKAIILFIGYLFFLFSLVNDILYGLKIIYIAINIAPLGFTILTLAQAIILARRFSDALITSEYLTLNLQKEVEKQTVKIENLLKQKTDFFINLAHETKTPLTIISNYLGKYIKENGSNLQLDIINQNFQKLKKDMVNYLDSEKIELNQILFDHDQICDISNLLENKCIIFKETALIKKIQLNWEIEKGNFIKADPMAIDRILNNLLENAIKYTNENGKIFVTLSSDSKQIKIVVTDSGIGISKAQIDNIFSPYHQLLHSKRNIQGLGIGLHITNNIIKSINGKIEVKSEEGKGSEFIIYLDKSIEDHHKSKIEDFNASKPEMLMHISENDIVIEDFDQKKKTIFLVEDNLQLVLTMKDEFNKEYNFFFAINGQEALKKLESLPLPDIIISDIMMDIMDGYTFREKLLKNVKYTKIPFIFLTAKSTKMDKLKGLSKGAIDYLNKPFEMSELKEKIKNWLIITKIQELKQDSTLKQKQDDKLMAFVTANNIKPKESEVIDYLLQGLKNIEIAEKMYISPNTVRKHIERIKEKLNLQTKKELIKIVYENVYI